MAKQPSVYILASRAQGTLYIGVTSDLLARLYQHRTKVGPSFAARYDVYRLVYYEFLAEMPAAIAREKQFKRWHRDWKINLIERDNPHWDDLAARLGLEPLLPDARKDGP